MVNREKIPKLFNIEYKVEEVKVDKGNYDTWKPAKHEVWGLEIKICLICEHSV